MSDQAEETPLVDLLRSIPEDYRGEWETQWDEDGRATGHAIAPIGLLAHKAVDTIESKERDIAVLVVAANTMLGCYDRNPANFALARVDLEEALSKHNKADQTP